MKSVVKIREGTGRSGDAGYSSYPLNNMNKFKIVFVCICMIFAATAQAQSTLAPHLQKHGTATQLVVEGKPFLILGGELANSSASSLEYMKPIWKDLASQGLNTVLAPISWELLEPREGEYDFALVDGLIEDAQKHNLKLVFLWFGSWKNTYSSYVPEWVKRDTKRFPRVMMKNGLPTERLTPLSASNRDADAKAYKALMKRIKDIDSKHTVLMMQVENEIGVIPDSRDFSESANVAFNADVPGELIGHLLKNSDKLSPELHQAWVSTGKKTSGSWKEVFGSEPITDDFFMAWHYAKYLDVIVDAGKAEYDIPMFTNAALIRPNYQPGQYNSGGPLPHSIDIYRAGAPKLDFIAPDIYFTNFAYWAGRYQSEGNPVFVPETYGGEAGAANAYYAFGQLNAIGFSPFGIDGRYLPPAPSGPASNPLATAYSTLAHLAPAILEKQGTDKIAGIVLEGSEQRSGKISFGGYDISVNWAGGAATGAADFNRRIGVLFIQTGEDEFLIAGSGSATLSFASSAVSRQTTGIASIDEEILTEGKWIWMRRLNGDENGQGQVLRLSSDRAAVYKVKLYKY